MPTYLQVVVSLLSYGIIQCGEVKMSKCPKCGKDVTELDKLLENHYFHVETYICKNCNCHFKVTR